MSVLPGGCGMSCERQEVLKDLMVSKKDMQETAPEDCQAKKIRGIQGGQKNHWYSCKRSTS